MDYRPGFKKDTLKRRLQSHQQKLYTFHNHTGTTYWSMITVPTQEIAAFLGNHLDHVLQRTGKNFLTSVAADREFRAGCAIMDILNAVESVQSSLRLLLEKNGGAKGRPSEVSLFFFCFRKRGKLKITGSPYSWPGLVRYALVVCIEGYIVIMCCAHEIRFVSLIRHITNDSLDL